MFTGWFGWKVPGNFLQDVVCSAWEFSIKVAFSFQVLAKFVVLRKPEGPKAALGERSLSVGSRNLLVQRRSCPLTWTYDPWLRSQPAHRVPQDGLLPQAQAALHELPGTQRLAPVPSHPAGSAAELQLSLEQVTEMARCVCMGEELGWLPRARARQRTGLASAASEISASEGHGRRRLDEEGVFLQGMLPASFPCIHEGKVDRWGPLHSHKAVNHPGTVGLELTVTVPVHLAHP